MATGKPTWYVGFSNCQSNILAELRHLYPRPHFLPEDAEIPNTDYIFMGYDEGAVMHVMHIQFNHDLSTSVLSSDDNPVFYHFLYSWTIFQD